MYYFSSPVNDVPASPRRVQRSHLLLLLPGFPELTMDQFLYFLRYLVPSDILAMAGTWLFQWPRV